MRVFDYAKYGTGSYFAVDILNSISAFISVQIRVLQQTFLDTKF